MNQAKEKLEQLAYLAKTEPWSDALEKAWVTTLGNALPDVTQGSLEYIPSMLMDKYRTKFYSDILAQTVKGKRVLEIGTGVGALAIAAIKNGAKHVVALECNSDAANIAKQTFKRNGVEDKVTLIEKTSLELTTQDIEGCEVIIHDLFGRDPFGEIACELLAHARTLLPRARFIPEGFTLNVSIVERSSLPHIFHSLPINDQIDLSPLERSRKDTLLPAMLDNSLWSSGQEIFRIEFKECKPLQCQEETIIGPGNEQAAVVWFEIFDCQFRLKSWGPESADHWGQMVWLPPTGARQIKFSQTATCLKVKAV